AFVKVLVSLGRVVKRDRLDIDGLGDLDLVVKDALHELPVVLHDRALAGVEGMALGPAEPNADAEHADLGILVDPARLAGDVKPRDAQRPAGTGDFHDGIEHGRGFFNLGVLPLAVRFEADAVDRAVHLRNPDDLFDLLGKGGVLGQVDRFTAKAAGL